METSMLFVFLARTVLALALAGGSGRAAGNVDPRPNFKQYCFQCHGKAAMGGINLERLSTQSVGEGYFTWARVADALEQQRMPPKGANQLDPALRQNAVSWIRAEMHAYASRHDGDPGRVTVRRLTSGEYAYAIRDLTGIDPDTGIDATTDSVGGEGFANFGDVQFMQDAQLERYLAAAKNVAGHAVIGAGPLEFYSDPGKTGFELSAVNRIKEIYAKHGFRTVSGEGGRPFGLEKYGKAFYAAWWYKHRTTLGQPGATLRQLAGREGISQRFAEHIWSVVNHPAPGYPVSEIVGRWKRLPAPSGSNLDAVRNQCEEIQEFSATWPSWFFARGDLAAGGAGDESPLVFDDDALKAEKRHKFTFVKFNRPGSRTPPGPTQIYLNVSTVNPAAQSQPVVIWKNATISYRKPAPPRNMANVPATGEAAAAPRRGFGQAGPKQPLRAVSPDAASKLDFGNGPAGIALGPGDFVTTSAQLQFEVPMEQGALGFELSVDAEVGSDPDQVLRVVISDRADGGAARGRPPRALLGDPASRGYDAFRKGVLQYANLLPPNSHGEPTPADKDPIPAPFDNTYNVPEHDEFIVKVKYLRDDKFVAENLLDPETRTRLDHAWNDLLASFEYYDAWLGMLERHFKLDLGGKTISTLDAAAIARLPEGPRKYIAPLRAAWEAVQAAQANGRRRHIEDCLELAARAWRRPLTEIEKGRLRTFYYSTVTTEKDHQAAIRALISRILVSPAFLYRAEFTQQAAAVQPLSNWDVASRLSFFLWSSIPDQDLRRAAATGELSNPLKLRAQVKRMLADPKARRLSTEFFGQWLGFYRFDQYKGVDTARFPEFTDDVRAAMYDEAVSFFGHVIGKDRPVRELVFSDYTFLNEALSKFYGVKKPAGSRAEVELVEGAANRGGLLRLGAVLTTTSGPLRTSPVKRGDWILRRLLGTPVPPPPADAGSIPADDKLFGSLSLREKLESHKRNATCAGCHNRIDPLGFPLEHFDSTGRWREKYADGKEIWQSGTLTTNREISGIDGLLDYLRENESQIRRTLSSKLAGYALGRMVQPSDQPLIDRMVALGGNATFAQLAAEIAVSKQFRTRAGSEPVSIAAAPRERKTQ
jgi:mono/diheme cytochrome c family protein